MDALSEYYLEISRVLRHKLQIISIVTAFFIAFALAVGVMTKAPLDVVLIIGGVGGLLISLFEEFYVQGRVGAWMRRMRPLTAIPIYAIVLCGT
jgi:hypothetical protein